MITEKLWEICESKEILQRFLEICNLFSNRIPDDELYDIGEVLVEIFSELRQAKEFGKLIDFTNLLLEKQPVLYEREFPIIVDELIDYFCYHRDGKQVERFFNYYIENPEKDFDMYLMGFQFILYYGYTDIIRKAVSENIEPIEKSEKYLPGAEDVLKVCGIDLYLEDYWRNNQEFDKNRFTRVICQYGYNPKEQYADFFNQVFYDHIPDKQEVTNLLMKNLADAMVMLYMMFLRYMIDRGIPVYISSTIWVHIKETLPHKRKKIQNLSTFFIINEKEFESYIVGTTGGIVTDYSSKLFALLWGAFYYNDFLRSLELIDEDVYTGNNKKLRHLKCRTIISYFDVLWRYDFLHSWQKPESVPEEEFNLEALIFKKSYELLSSDWDALAEQLKDELVSASKFADELEAAKIEIQEELARNKQSSFNLERFDTLDFDDDDDFDDFDDYDDDDFDDDEVVDVGNVTFNKKPEMTLQPIRREPKIGRNEPCPCGSGKKYKKCCGKP